MLLGRAAATFLLAGQPGMPPQATMMGTGAGVLHFGVGVGVGDGGRSPSPAFCPSNKRISFFSSRAATPAFGSVDDLMAAAATTTHGIGNLLAQQLPPAVLEKQTLSSLHNGARVDKKKDKKSISMLTWEDKFALVRQYKKEHGHCNPPVNYVIHGVKLGGWVATQRKEYQKYQAGLYSPIINAKRIYRLERNGFQWEEELQLDVAVVRAMKSFICVANDLLEGFATKKGLIGGGEFYPSVSSGFITPSTDIAYKALPLCPTLD